MEIEQSQHFSSEAGWNQRRYITKGQHITYITKHKLFHDLNPELSTYIFLGLHEC